MGELATPLGDPPPGDGRPLEAPQYAPPSRPAAAWHPSMTPPEELEALEAAPVGWHGGGEPLPDFMAWIDTGEVAGARGHPIPVEFEFREEAEAP